MARKLMSWLREETAAASLFFIAAMPMVLIVAGVAIDGSAAFSEQRILQTAANTASLSAALYIRSNPAATVIQKAQDYANTNLPIASNGGHSVLASTDVKTGNWNFTTNTFKECPGQQVTCADNVTPVNAVRVIVRRSTENQNPFPTSLLGLVKRTGWKISALSVAAIPATGGYCLVAMDPSGSSSINFGNGNGSFSLSGCGLAVNSTSNSAINTGNTQVSISNGLITTVAAGPLNTQSNGQGGIQSGTTVVTGQTAANDPYSSVPLSAAGTVGSCTVANTNPTFSSGTVPAGTYCGLRLQGTAKLSGTYIINGGTLTISSSITQASGSSGTTIALTGSGNNWGKIALGSGLTISAPTSGPLSGIAIFGDRSAPAHSITITITSNNTTLGVTGAIYIPTGDFSAPNSFSFGSTCTQLIAYDISISNHASYSWPDSCNGTGVFAVGHARLAL